MAAPASLKQLLEQSKRLTNHITNTDLPQIERGLEQIESQSRKLVAKASRAGEGLDTRAYVFKLTRLGEPDPKAKLF